MDSKLISFFHIWIDKIKCIVLLDVGLLYLIQLVLRVNWIVMGRVLDNISFGIYEIVAI